MKNQIKELLLAGKTQNQIGELLSIGQSTVSKYKQLLIKEANESDRNKNKLASYQNFILGCLESKKSARYIHTCLLSDGLTISYSTTLNFIRELKQRIESEKLEIESTGEAIIGLLPIGQFSDRDTKTRLWIFTLVMASSRYAYFKEVTSTDSCSLINATINALRFLKKVPTAIIVAKKGNINITRKSYRQTYSGFLKYYGASLKTENKSSVVTWIYNETIQFLRQTFLNRMFIKNTRHLPKQLQRWNKNIYAFRFHPVTDKTVTKEFQRLDVHLLKDIPKEPYLFIGRKKRKADKNAIIQFEYNKYELPKKMAGCRIELACETKIISFYANGLLVCRKRRSNNSFPK